ncbi:MAG: hypothetical protein ACOYMN_00275, partial [Roseimicrobium sp.]
SDAREYTDKHLKFFVGTVPLNAEWAVQPIDSDSVFPLSDGSKEVHLLAEHRGALPAVPGPFKVSVAKECAVAVILLNSLASAPDRSPQSLFPGESSRGFALPEPPALPLPVVAARERPAGQGSAAPWWLGGVLLAVLAVGWWLKQKKAKAAPLA